MQKYDVIIIGAGAAGLTAARVATERGRNVAVFDLGATPARKVMVSGGGRCNITNAAAAHDRYFGKNPDFVRSALARVTPGDILQWCAGHGIDVTEKSVGQYFCIQGAAAVVNALVNDACRAKIYTNAQITDIIKNDDGFIITNNNTRFIATSVIIATGGVSFPTLGVSDFGYRIAKQFGHAIIPPRPALCPIVMQDAMPALAGIAMPVEIKIGKQSFSDSMLFTHTGLGGPAIYRATVRDGAEFTINMVPGLDAGVWLRQQKRENGRRNLGATLACVLPTRVALWIAGGDAPRNIADIRDAELDIIADKISNMRITKFKYHSMAGAEVTRGGVDTDNVSSKTMESKLMPGLFFAGEALDVAGDLGGFNLHWAWASGTVAGQNA